MSTSMEVTDATVFKVIIMTDDTAIRLDGPFASYSYLILKISAGMALLWDQERTNHLYVSIE